LIDSPVHSLKENLPLLRQPRFAAFITSLTVMRPSAPEPFT
jgi:hypothetical protein